MLATCSCSISLFCHKEVSLSLILFPLAFPEGSNVYADAAYTNYAIEDMLKNEGIFLQVQCKVNSLRKDTPWAVLVKKQKRKIIETSISGIKFLFLRTIHAVTFKDFIIKPPAKQLEG